MTDIRTLGRTAWRDYATDGSPSSGAHQPLKSEILAFVDAVENIAAAPVTSKTANYNLAASDHGKDFDNNGASGSVTFFLHAAAVGFFCSFTVMENFSLIIDAPPGVKIYYQETETSEGGTLHASYKGAVVFIKCRSATEWVAQFSSGFWTPA